MSSRLTKHLDAPAIQQEVATQHGHLRNPDGGTLQAANDLVAVDLWLKFFEHRSEHTLRAYRREAHRLLLWASLERGRPLSGLTHEDWLVYQQFLADPQPAERWVGPKVPENDPAWRPFIGPLSPGSRRQAMTILNGLLSFLVETLYLRANPLALVRKRDTAPRRKSISRYLDTQAWDAVVHHIEGWSRRNPYEVARYERARWILSFSYLAGPRASDMIGHTMGSIQKVSRGGVTRWWWTVAGKGRTEENADRVPLVPDLVEALIRYRRSLGLQDEPTPDEATPLACRVARRGGGERAPFQPLSYSGIAKTIKRIFEGAAAEVEHDAPVVAQQLRRASAHWLRHTALTRMADAGVELRHIQRAGRHHSIETTAIYLHTEDEALAKDLGRHRLGWERRE